jgi:hypothetical protein
MRPLAGPAQIACSIVFCVTRRQAVAEEQRGCACMGDVPDLGQNDCASVKYVRACISSSSVSMQLFDGFLRQEVPSSKLGAGVVTSGPAAHIATQVPHHCHTLHGPGSARHKPWVFLLLACPGLLLLLLCACCCMRLISLCVMLFGVVLLVRLADCCVSLVEPAVRLSPWRCAMQQRTECGGIEGRILQPSLHSNVRAGAQHPGLVSISWSALLVIPVQVLHIAATAHSCMPAVKQVRVALRVQLVLRFVGPCMPLRLESLCALPP